MKLLLTATCFLISISSYAQNVNMAALDIVDRFTKKSGMTTITENFESNKFNWDEFMTKEGNVLLSTNGLQLTNATDSPLATICNLPIVSDEDFNLLTLINSRIDDKTLVGVVFNYEDEENYWTFLLKEGESYLCHVVNGKIKKVRRNPIILKKGKDVVFALEMLKKGKNITFSIDNMEIKTHAIPVVNNVFGYVIMSKGDMTTTYLGVQQYAHED